MLSHSFELTILTLFYLLAESKDLCPQGTFHNSEEGKKQNKKMKSHDTEMQSLHILGLLDFREQCKKTGHISDGGQNVSIMQLTRKLMLENRMANLRIVTVNMVLCLYEKT